jgi:hypothetical protein
MHANQRRKINFIGGVINAKGMKCSAPLSNQQNVLGLLSVPVLDIKADRRGQLSNKDGRESHLRDE